MIFFSIKFPFCRQNNTGLLLTDNFVVMDMRTCGGVRLYLVNQTNDVIWRLSFNLYTTYRNFYIYPCNCTSNSLPSRWAVESLLVLRPPAYTFTAIFIHVQNTCKRRVSLNSSISKPYIQSNSMLLRWHWCRICAAAENTGFMAASGEYSFKIGHQLRWPRFVPLNFNGSQWKSTKV